MQAGSELISGRDEDRADKTTFSGDYQMSGKQEVKQTEVVKISC